MRHLLTILAGVPAAFWYPGLTLVVASLLLAVPSMWGPLQIGNGIRFFGPHTQALSILIGFYGAVFLSLALSLYGRATAAKQTPRLAGLLTRLREDVLFWVLMAFFGAFLLGGLYTLWQWSKIPLLGSGVLEIHPWSHLFHAGARGSRIRRISASSSETSGDLTR